MKKELYKITLEDKNTKIVFRKKLNEKEYRLFQRIDSAFKELHFYRGDPEITIEKI